MRSFSLAGVTPSVFTKRSVHPPQLSVVTHTDFMDLIYTVRVYLTRATDRVACEGATAITLANQGQ